ncbi:probable glycosyltransferase At3g07620 [Neltuma alba]|uniref:probable glycosyltransferase At3g07620 n=1 Tax=Neltuma alba TaxID=207710 RepID=UPI0010A59633|nr:probable glycosyltransferase At3g07620 [Prosopis alba]XP_028786428.1 probable glycosyltransferase At3g07620 [Prosopis alba]
MRLPENHTFSFNFMVLLIILISSLILAFVSGFFPSLSLAIVPTIFSASSDSYQEKPPYSPPPVNTSDSTEISEAQVLSGPVQIQTPTSKNFSEAQVASSVGPVQNQTPTSKNFSEAQVVSSVGPIQNQTATSKNLGGEKVDAELNYNGTEKVSNSTNQKDKKLKMIEARLAQVRSSIKEASKVRNLTSTHHDPEYVPRGPVYRNPNAFHRSYLEMEKVFKIFVYEEGEPPIFHDAPCKNIYSSEGRFIHEIEKRRHYRTDDPDEAFVYFLPFSVAMLVGYIYTPTRVVRSIGPPVVDYLQTVSEKYPFWNRSLGLDHFMLSCHDWGPLASSFVPQLYHNSIRVLCNANTSEGFKPAKDATLPEINLVTGEIAGLGGYSPSRRNILAFFAGGHHGYIRYLLFQQWKDKDQDVQVYDEFPRGASYYNMLRRSRFCLCPSGYEVASPRIVEAIFAECVPVLISDSYVPPFSDVLNWKSFSVQIDVKDIANIKKILMEIPQRQYLRMQRRVKIVQRHFVPNDPPKRFDVFHMITHSIWLRRLNVQVQHQ